MLNVNKSGQIEATSVKLDYNRLIEITDTCQQPDGANASNKVKVKYKEP